MTPAYGPPPVPDVPIELTKENVQPVLTSGKLVVIDLWAPWCGPCKMFLPVFTSVAQSFGNNDVVFAKCNIDEQPWIAEQFGVKAVPTLIITRGDQVLYNEARGLDARSLNELVNRFV